MNTKQWIFIFLFAIGLSYVMYTITGGFQHLEQSELDNLKQELQEKNALLEQIEKNQRDQNIFLNGYALGAIETEQQIIENLLNELQKNNGYVVLNIPTDQNTVQELILVSFTREQLQSLMEAQ